jgi:hypothetical protein
MFAALCLAAPTALAAQLPGGSARAMGMGGAYGALARGYEAPAWNPALLGISRQPHFSIGLPQAQVEFSNNAYTFSDIRTYADSSLTDADKQYLLSRIVNDDSTLAMNLDVGLAGLGVSVGHLAFSISQSVFASGAMPRDAVEFALYGNWGASGANVLQLAGTGGHGWASTTLAGSYGYPLHLAGHPGAIGVTVKRVWGNFLGQMSNTLSSISVDSINVNASTIYTNYESGQSITSVTDLFGRAPATGIGVDLGGAIELANRHVTLSAALVNLVGGMKWDSDRLRYTNSVYTLHTTPAGTVADTASFIALTDPTAIENDPQARALRDSLLETTDFARLLRFGGAWRTGKLTAASDLQFQLSAGLDYHPGVLWSAGAEYALLGFLPVRAGFRSDFAKTTAVSAGLGLRLGPVALDLSGAAILGSLHPGVVTAVGLGLLF